MKGYSIYFETLNLNGAVVIIIMDVKDIIKLKFDTDFFDEEVRCDYRITSETKKIWAVELDLLNELIRVCNKYDIKMCLSCGALLGAVRHGGMIPWDDDIDVSLNRTEYAKLCKVAQTEFKNPYFFQTYESDPQYLFGYARLRNSLTTGYIVGMDNLCYNNGIYIDVFVMDGFIDDVQLLKAQEKKLRNLIRLSDIYKGNFRTGNVMKRIVKRCLYSVFSPLIRAFYSYDEIVSSYLRCQQQYNDSTDRVAIISDKLYGVRKNWCKKEDLEDIIYVPFENLMAPIPSNYHFMLSNAYGNYMDYPPIEKRGVWHKGIIEFDPETPYIEYLKKARRKWKVC